MEESINYHSYLWGTLASKMKNKSHKEQMKTITYPPSSGQTTVKSSLLALMTIYLEFGAYKENFKGYLKLKIH